MYQTARIFSCDPELNLRSKPTYKYLVTSKAVEPVTSRLENHSFISTLCEGQGFGHHINSAIFNTSSRCKDVSSGSFNVMINLPFVRSRSAAYGLLSLEFRRRLADCIFLFKLLNYQINCPFFLDTINFHVPARSTRHRCLFETDHAGTNYLRFSPIPRLMRFANEIGSSVDLFVAILRAIRRAAADGSLFCVSRIFNT
ncbi:hypothetical protein J6590_098925 [Homalodisca vitripennis]|nr:hypothetical protein J6590_098925 [Homalodisca vitripennis]